MRVAYMSIIVMVLSRTVALADGECYFRPTAKLIKEAQLALKLQGFDSGQANGSQTAKTDKALQAFKQKHMAEIGFIDRDMDDPLWNASVLEALIGPKFDAGKYEMCSN